MATYDANASLTSAGLLVFDYTVGAADHTSNLAITGANLHGAAFLDATGNNADFSGAFNVATGLQVVATPPTVSSVTVGPSMTAVSGMPGNDAFAAGGGNDVFTGNGGHDSITFHGASSEYTLDKGTLVTITLGMNIPVTVTGGTPSLSLSDGSSAVYDATYSSPTSLVFDEILSHNANLSVSGINLNGATVAGVGGNAADLSGALTTLNGVPSPTPGMVSVLDQIASHDGINELVNVEFLKFSDQTTFIENADSANIARLYSSALNRAPDIGGESGWQDIYANNISAAVKAQGVYAALAQTNDGYGTSIAGGFVQSAEFQHLYGSLDDAGYVTQLYENVLNRPPEQAGLSGWLSLMHDSGFTRDMVLVGFAESAENIAKTAGWLIQV
jgi:hypothetical protein